VLDHQCGGPIAPRAAGPPAFSSRRATFEEFMTKVDEVEERLIAKEQAA